MLQWIKLEGVLRIIELARKGEWKWIHNSQCKYIDIRIDMRDGNCIIANRAGKNISLEELEHQAWHTTVEERL